MEIFQAERKAGLESLLSCAKAVIQYETPLDSRDLEAKTIASLIHNNKTLANYNDSDLYSLNSLMVSVGWNKNEDVFLRDRVWAARNTPEDKPLNIQHQELDIIGHIIGNYVIDNDGKTIPNDLTVEELPTDFHIIASSVIYRHWTDKTRAKEVGDMIAQIQEDLENKDKTKAQWFVSMECSFTGFDYAVIDESGKQYIVPRNEESAFLTARLKAYGGDGKYGQYRVGRAMKNIAFSALGLVKKPANPASVIFDGVLSFREESSSQVNEIMETVMANDNSNELLNEYKDKIAKLEASLTANTSKIDTLENEKKEISNKVSQLESDLSIANSKVSTLENEKTELTKTLADTNVKLNENIQALETIKAAEVKAKRVASFVEKGMSKEDAEKQVEKFVGLNDETFEALAALVNVTKTEPAKPEAVPTPEQAASAAASVIDTAVEIVKPALQVSDTDNAEKEQAKASLGDFIGSFLVNKKKQN